MLHTGEGQWWIEGPRGMLPVPPGDEVVEKLAMLVEGECEGLGAAGAARKFGYSPQRYYQVYNAFLKEGAQGLQSAKRGPKTQYRRTGEVVRQVIRYKFMDHDASPEVIAQKLRQTGWEISARSVERVVAEYGLQKKTSCLPARRPRNPGNATHPPETPPRTV